jgi:GTPase
VPQLRVMNKIDLTGGKPAIHRDAEGRPDQVWLSAASGEGLDLLRQALGERLGGERIRAPLQLPLSAGRMHARLAALGAIASEDVDADGWTLQIDAPRNVLAPLAGTGDEAARAMRTLIAPAETPD